MIRLMPNDIERIEAGDLSARHLGRMLLYTGRDGGEGHFPIAEIWHQDGWTRIEVNVLGGSVETSLRTGEIIGLVGFAQ